MSTVKATPYYLFTREQLLGALEAYTDRYVAESGTTESEKLVAFEIRGCVLNFLGSPEAIERGLLVNPKPISVGENAV